jgi:hypothetical protein
MKKEQQHTSGFKIPDNYFKTLEETIETRLYLEEFKSSGFKVPKDYLTDFEVNLENKTKQTKVISIFRRKNLMWATSVAAAVLLLFTLSTPRNTQSIDTLESQALENYLVDEMSYNEFETLTVDINVSETDFITINENNLETYIDNLDVDDLINY